MGRLVNDILHTFKENHEVFEAQTKITSAILNKLEILN